MGRSFENTNYYVVQGWMVNELKLKGNELIIFAIINGFSQEKNSWYTGSLSYLMECTNCSSKNTIIKCLNNLIEKKYIIKQSTIKNNIKFCRYSINDMVYQNLIWGISKNDTNNNNIIIENNISKDILKEKPKKSTFTKPTLEEIKAYCDERNNNVDYQKFYDYYESNDWKDKNGNKVINWKMKLIANWENKSNVNNKQDDKYYPKTVKNGNSFQLI